MRGVFGPDPEERLPTESSEQLYENYQERARARREIIVEFDEWMAVPAGLSLAEYSEWCRERGKIVDLIEWASATSEGPGAA